MAIWTPANKNTSTWATENVAGKAWLYDESDLQYDMGVLNYNLYRAVSVWSRIASVIKCFLLQEDGYNLLLEDGGKIIVEPQTGVNWENEIKH